MCRFYAISLCVTCVDIVPILAIFIMFFGTSRTHFSSLNVTAWERLAGYVWLHEDCMYVS